MVDHCHQRLANGHINLWFFFSLKVHRFLTSNRPTGQHLTTNSATFTFVFVIGWCLFYFVARCFSIHIECVPLCGSHTDAGSNGNSIRYSQKQIRWNDIHKQSKSIRCNGQMVSSHFSCVVFFVTICKRLNIWPLHEEQQTAHIEQCLNGLVWLIFAAFFLELNIAL